jgi:hypothetical protein
MMTMKRMVVLLGSGAADSALHARDEQWHANSTRRRRENFGTAIYDARPTAVSGRPRLPSRARKG